MMAQWIVIQSLDLAVCDHLLEGGILFSEFFWELAFEIVLKVLMKKNG